MFKLIVENLPGFNCGNCGYQNCEDFARGLLEKKNDLAECSVLSRTDYLASKKTIEKTLGQPGYVLAMNNEPIIGVIDRYEADIILKPLKGESSCREVLLPFYRDELKTNEVIRYRPLGCPITHIAKIIETQHSLITVQIIGPENNRNGENQEIKDIGMCMVIAFRGSYEGKSLKVGETIRFLPHHCMMQKVHSGVVVNLEKGSVLIEAIDLKVWGMAEEVTEKEISTLSPFRKVRVH